jgi:phosphate transport system substrate-binding protein
MVLVFFLLAFDLFAQKGPGAGPAATAEPPRLSEELYHLDYAPFTGERTAFLDEKAELTLKHNLPYLDGATAAFPVYAAIVQAVYAPQSYYSSEKAVQFSTTRQAYEALVERRADIIFCYAPSPEQEQMAAERGLRYRLIPLCKDAFVFIVNKNNPVRNLSLEQIRGIYSGRITNWKDAGGRDETIIPYQRNEGSGSQTAFLKIMKGVTVMEAPAENVPMGMGMMLDRVADYRNNENALGYSFRFFTQEMERNDGIELLSIDGIAPVPANIQNGAYPFTETLYAITLGNESPNTQKLLEWILSDQGQRLIEKTGYVPTGGGSWVNTESH